MLITDIHPAKVISTMLCAHRMRSKVYGTLAAATPVRLFRRIFEDSHELSGTCAGELEAEIFKLGGTPAAITLDPESAQAIEMMGAASESTIHTQLLHAVLHEQETLLDLYFGALGDTDESINTQHHLVFYRHYTQLSALRDKTRNLVALSASASN